MVVGPLKSGHEHLRARFKGLAATEFSGRPSSFWDLPIRNLTDEGKDIMSTELLENGAERYRTEGGVTVTRQRHETPYVGAIEA